MKTYHDRIMNLQIPKPDDDTRGLPAVVETMEYKEGYRDARHAAAEIANEADGRIEELEQAKQPRRSPWKAAAKRYRRLFRLPTHMVTHCSNCIATEQRSVELEALVASYARQRIRDIRERQQLRAKLAVYQESEFHPDWSLLEATRKSLSEHQKMLREARVELARLRSEPEPPEYQRTGGDDQC